MWDCHTWGVLVLNTCNNVIIKVLRQGIPRLQQETWLVFGRSLPWRRSSMKSTRADPMRLVSRRVVDSFLSGEKTWRFKTEKIVELGARERFFFQTACRWDLPHFKFNTMGLLQAPSPEGRFTRKDMDSIRKNWGWTNDETGEIKYGKEANSGRTMVVEIQGWGPLCSWVVPKTTILGKTCHRLESRKGNPTDCGGGFAASCPATKSLELAVDFQLEQFSPFWDVLRNYLNFSKPAAP